MEKKNCIYDIPDEENPDFPGMDEMNPGLDQMNPGLEQMNPGEINIDLNKEFHFKNAEDDIFEFSLPAPYGKSAPKRIGLIPEPAMPAPDGVSAPCPYTGKLYQELAIKVESNYYTSPATHFTIQPAQYKEVADLTCYVKSYDLTLTVKADPDIAVQYKTPNSALRDMMVVLIRENKPADVPEMEGIAGGIDNAAIAKFIINAEKLFNFTGTELHVNVDNTVSDGTYEFGTMYPDLELGYMNGYYINESDIIGCGFVDVNGKVTFKNLVKNIGSLDEYTLLAIPDYENSDINYLIPVHDFYSNFSNVSSHPYGPLTINTTESTVKEGFYPKMKLSYTLDAIPQNPIMFGKVLRSDNGYPLLGCRCSITDNPATLEMQTKTASDGIYFLTLTKEQYNSNSVSLFTRQLKFSKYGYDDTYSAYPLYLKKGKILNRVADTIQPAVLVTGYIYTEVWNEAESLYEAAPAYVQIGNGPQVHTECEPNDFILDLGKFNDYVESQPELDITTLVPNYEEMWEGNYWDPSIQVFQNNYDIEGNVLGSPGTETFEGGGAMFNRSLDVNTDDGGYDMGAGNKGVTTGGLTTGKIGEVAPDKGVTGGTTTMGGGMTLGGTGNNCDLAFYTTFASRGTWLAEINPDSSKYITRIENVYIPDTGNVLRVDFTVYKKLHRCHFIVKDINGAAVNADIEIVGITDVLNTGTDGIRDIIFENGGNTFTVLINGATASDDFIQKEMVITNSASEFAVTYNVELLKGATISGKVTNGTPAVANARVFIDAAGMENLETYTDANGNYTLYGVPKTGGFTMRAVKEGTGLIGDSHWVVTATATNITNMNFNLTNYTSMDLSKLVGFKTEIEYLSSYGGEIKISGSLVDIADNTRFGLEDDVELPFNYVKIKASTTLNGSGVLMPSRLMRHLP
ncbi:MAG: carboxypeptidase regulatory-like domain-containing protein [Bacteroidetes bacterium]|nr:carboxypeptidase regulatory-like domain-containing protein [Bacteroidota bacterium]